MSESFDHRAASAAMFGGVTYLAVRQYRFERLIGRTIQAHAADVYGAVEKMSEGQLAWTAATVKEIEKAWNPPPHRPTEVKYKTPFRPVEDRKMPHPWKGWGW